MKKSDITIYPAAALFNGRSTYFNQALVAGLEEKGYKTNFPQRDGFEFGNLNKALMDKLPESEVPSAVEKIIYYLDMGIFVPQSHVILANLDEPQDEGVLVELAHAKNISRHNIGFRTDVRSPYGSSSDGFGGMHFFPGLYLCDTFIQHYMPCKTPQDAKTEMQGLVDKIDKEISPMEFSNIKPATDNILFSGIKDIHSLEGLRELVERYISNKDKLESYGPKIVR
ncbi:hypothetical protein J4226_03525 [Candidatus Pacearchaeota archaeon]|nr:hypothetical protein [Candidatus Pacearchaeota archaeon]